MQLRQKKISTVFFLSSSHTTENVWGKLKKILSKISFKLSAYRLIIVTTYKIKYNFQTVQTGQSIDQYIYFIVSIQKYIIKL